MCCSSISGASGAGKTSVRETIAGELVRAVDGPGQVAFAAWLRRHACDPAHMPHVLTTGGWDGMRGRG